MPLVVTKPFKATIVGCTYYNVTHIDYWETVSGLTYYPGSPGSPYWELNIGPFTASITAYSGFSSGYRPSKIKIRFDNDSYNTQLQFKIYDTNNNQIGDSGVLEYPPFSSSSQEVEIDLTYTSFDFSQVYIDGLGNGFTNMRINEFELCSTTPPASPPF